MTTYKNQVVAALGMLCALAAVAAPSPSQIFTAEDLAPGGVVTAVVLGARDAFLTKLDNTVQSYGFEQNSSFFPPTGVFATLPVTFSGSVAGGAITATLEGSNTEVAGVDSAGRFNTTTPGAQYVQVLASSSSAFSILFSRGISAFGFYGTDIGDFDGLMELELLRANGTGTDTLTVRNTASAASNNGALLFYGFADAASSYTKITFKTSGAAGSTALDYFGFDDFWVADANQIRQPVDPNPTPEPGSLALVGLALFAAGWARKTQRRT